MSFAGKRVLALESRRATETAELIRRNGGEPVVAPSMREVPLETNNDALLFAERLFSGTFDCMIFLTGVGTRYLATLVALRHGPDAFPSALRKITVVARGPKPIAALRELNVPVQVTVPEPNTWREIVAVMQERPERNLAVQLYGAYPKELLESLQTNGRTVTPVPIYTWALPDDTEPLKQAAMKLSAGHFDFVLLTSSHQIVHLMQVARDLGIEAAVHAALKNTTVASIGPDTSNTLREFGIEPAMEPSHPKLGILVKEAAEYAPARS